MGAEAAVSGEARLDLTSTLTSSDKENPSLVFSGGREIPTRGSTIPVGNEASPSFPLERWTRRLEFPGSTVQCTPMIDSISHISNKE